MRDIGVAQLDTDEKRIQAQELAAQIASGDYTPDEVALLEGYSDELGIGSPRGGTASRKLVGAESDKRRVRRELLDIDLKRITDGTPQLYTTPQFAYEEGQRLNPIDLTEYIPAPRPTKAPSFLKKKKKKKMIKEDEIRTAALLPEDRREVIDLTGFNEEPVVRSGVSRVDTSGSKVDSSGNVRKFKPSGGGRRGARKKKVVAKKAVEPTVGRTVRLPDGDQGFAGGGNDADPNADLLRQTGGGMF